MPQAATTAMTPVGVDLLVQTGSPLAYASIPEVISIETPDGALNLLDATSLRSPNGVMEWIKGMRDEGQMTFEVNYLPDDTYHQVLETNRAAGTLTKLKVTFTDTSPQSLTFDCYLLSAPISVSQSSPIRRRWTAKVTGAIAFA